MREAEGRAGGKVDVDGKFGGGVHGHAEVLGDVAEGEDVG